MPPPVKPVEVKGKDMYRQKAGSGIILIFFVCFIIMSLSSEAFILTHADHDCSGEGCPLCIQIEWTRNFSRQLRYAPFQFFFPLGALLFSAFALKPVLFHVIPISSVSLKVKMNR
jgi:hypothetical protein